MIWCSWSKRNSAQKRYQRAGLFVVLSYFAFFFGATGIAHYVHPQGWALYLTALLPGLPIVGLLFIVGRYLREEKDEFQRDLVIRCLLWGIAAVVTVEMFTSFLRTFGWHGRLPPFTAYFVLCGTMLAAKLTYKYRNRITSDDQ